MKYEYGKRILASPHLPWILAILAILLSTPSMLTGFCQDDHLLIQRFRGSGEIPGTKGHALDGFAFGDGDPQTNQAKMNLGIVPWWTAPYWKVAFGRVLTAITHWIDWYLAGARAWPMHLHSILWYALLVWLVARFYRRLFDSPWLAGLAALLFTLDPNHAVPITWIAARNALTSSVFVILTLHLHDRWRRDEWKPARYLAWLTLGTGLFMSEATVATGAYLAAYALCLDPKRPVRGFGALLPYLAIVIIWRVLYTLWGYGVAHQLLYIDPIQQYRLFLSDLPTSMIALLFSLVSKVECAWISFVPTGLKAAGLAIMITVVALCTWLFLPLLRTNRFARFWALGMVLSLVPVCTTNPQGRELMNPSIGGAALLALFLGDWLAHRRNPSTAPRLLFSRFRGFSAGVLLTLHVFLPVVLLPYNTYTVTKQGERFVRWISDRAPKDPAMRQRSLIILYAPADIFASFTPILRAANNEPVPKHTWMLCAGIQKGTAIRESDRTLVLQMDETFLTRPFSQVFRDIQTDPFQVGDIVKLDGMTAEIRTINQGHPTTVAFTFDVPLDDPSLCWMTFTDLDYRTLQIPATGESIPIRGFNLTDAIDTFWKQTRTSHS